MKQFAIILMISVLSACEAPKSDYAMKAENLPAPPKAEKREHAITLVARINFPKSLIMYFSKNLL